MKEPIERVAVKFPGETKTYLIPKREAALGFTRPERRSYIHTKCGTVTEINTAITETFARNPKFFGDTHCDICKERFPVGDFIWNDGSGEAVGA